MQLKTELTKYISKKLTAQEFHASIWKILMMIISMMMINYPAHFLINKKNQQKYNIKLISIKFKLIIYFLQKFRANLIPLIISAIRSNSSKRKMVKLFLLLITKKLKIIILLVIVLKIKILEICLITVKHFLL